MENFVVVDIETTGLSAGRHKITEIAAIKYSDGNIVDEFVTLVNPKEHIPSFITKLTGISDDMVKDQPEIGKVLPGFHEFIGNMPFIAHNATFDFNFLDHFLWNNMQLRMENPKICTCMLARRLMPELTSKKLGNVCEALDIKNIQAHRAKSDTIATGEVFLKFLVMMKEKEIVGLKSIMKFQKSKISHCY